MPHRAAACSHPERQPSERRGCMTRGREHESDRRSGDDAVQVQHVQFEVASASKESAPIVWTPVATGRSYVEGLPAATQGV